MAEKKIVVACALAASASMALVGNAHGGVVILGNSGWQAEWADSLNTYVDIGLDGVTANAVFIEKSAQFIQGPVNGIFPSIAITFRQISPIAVSNIVINDEIITNSTGVGWTDFHMSLLNHGDVTFDPVSTANSGGTGPIGFSIHPFTTASYSDDFTELNISGGTVLNGTVWNPGSGDSDGQLWIHANLDPDIPMVFTLKERPTIDGVPAPGALAVLGLGAALRNRRRKS